MRTASLMLALVAALHFVLISTPCFAQGAPPVQPAHSAPVQPVPYNTSQPVQYGAQPVQVAPTPAPAPAGAPGTPDTVVLKNGGMIRGTLVEVLPNDHATVQLPSGQSAIVQWGEIHHIERGAAPTAVTPPPGATPMQKMPNATAPMSGPTVLVHIETGRPVTLDRRNPGDDQPWVTACESPCDVQLPLNNDYRIVGEGIWASSEFELDGQPGQRVVVKVAPATRLARTAGIVVAGAGLLAIIIGVYVVAIAAAASCSSSVSANGCNSDNSGGVAIGVVLMLGGLVTMAVGGIIILANWRTGESQEVQSPAKAARLFNVPGVPNGDNAYKRLPTFHEPAAAEKVAPVTTFPLFSTTF
jgi:hypothetical protein